MHTRGFIDSPTYSEYLSTCINPDNERSTACEALQKKIQTAFYSSKANVYNVYGVCYPVPTGSPFFDHYLDSAMARE